MKRYVAIISALAIFTLAVNGKAQLRVTYPEYDSICEIGVSYVVTWAQSIGSVFTDIYVYNFTDESESLLVGNSSQLGYYETDFASYLPGYYALNVVIKDSSYNILASTKSDMFTISTTGEATNIRGVMLFSAPVNPIIDNGDWILLYFKYFSGLCPDIQIYYVYWPTATPSYLGSAPTSTTEASLKIFAPSGEGSFYLLCSASVYYDSKHFYLRDPTTDVTIVDYRTHPANGLIKSNLGCSVRFHAFTGLYEFSHALGGEWPFSFSNKEIYDCTPYGSCGSGDSHMSTMYVRENNLTSFAMYPDNGTNDDCLTPTTKYMPFTKYYSIYGPSPDLMLSYIRKYGPLIIPVDYSGAGLSTYFSGIVLKNNATCVSSSSFLLVVGAGTEEGTDYWIMKQAFGSSYGEGGHIRIERGVNAYCVEDSFVFAYLNERSCSNAYDFFLDDPNYVGYLDHGSYLDDSIALPCGSEVEVYGEFYTVNLTEKYYMKINSISSLKLFLFNSCVPGTVDGCLKNFSSGDVLNVTSYDGIFFLLISGGYRFVDFGITFSEEHMSSSSSEYSSSYVSSQSLLSSSSLFSSSSESSGSSNPSSSSGISSTPSSQSAQSSGSSSLSNSSSSYILPEESSCISFKAAYGTPISDQLAYLRIFRDTILLKSDHGKASVSLYYTLSPILKVYLHYPYVETIVRFLLVPVVLVVRMLL